MEPITLDMLVKCLPEKTYLRYVDYRDSFSDSLDAVQKAIQTGELESLDDCINYDGEQEDESVAQYIKNVVDSLSREHDRDSVEAAAEEHHDELDAIIRERDHSDVIKDLLKHTGSEPMFYETGLSCEEAWSKDSIRRKERMRIKKHLGIKKSTWDKEIDSMLSDAGYGGQLVIYFYKPVGDMIGGEARTIRFRDPVIAIVDHGGGSGGDCELKGCILDLPFNRKKIFIDRCVRYSYTHEVCGMSDNWCDGTQVAFPDVEPAVVWEEHESETEAHMLQEAEYSAVYAKGKCSFGDMNITRHRDTYYINDYPCGTKCPHCGTFWID